MKTNKLISGCCAGMASLLVVAGGMAAESTEEFRGKQRLLVVSGATAEFVAEAEKEKEGQEVRDLRIFILDGVGEEKYPVGEELRAELEERFAPKGDPKENPEVTEAVENLGTVWLIGKDGNTALQWTIEEFSFEKAFVAIDGMPLRQQEVQEMQE